MAKDPVQVATTLNVRAREVHRRVRRRNAAVAIVAMLKDGMIVVGGSTSAADLPKLLQQGIDVSNSAEDVVDH